MIRTVYRHSLFLVFVIVLSIQSHAFCQTDVKLQVAGLINDNMVVQRDQPLVVWGWAAPGTEVTVRMLQQQKSATAADDTSWQVEMDPIGLGPAFEIEVITAAETKTFTNCIAGEVWICSGQSNMEWTVRASGNPQEEIAAADYPMIRHINIENRTAPLPNTGNFQCSGWNVCSPATAADFTAVGYYFARELHQELDIPIGLINTTWGGTIVEAWTSPESCSTVEAFKDRVAEIQDSAGDAAGARELQQRVDQWNRDFQAALADESDQWQGTDIDDSEWGTMKAPGQWESQGLAQLDGVVWFRKTITIDENLAGKPALLSIGMIDDYDKTYVNGQLVGSTNAWGEARRYEVAADLVTAGEMTIATRVVDPHGGGGFHGEAENYFLEVEGQDRIVLAGDWKYKVARSTAALERRPVNPIQGPNHPTVLYNAMVSPILNASFRGAIWYQGESNAGRAYQYRTIFPLLITDWRKQFGRDFPFYWVQLANFRPANDQPVDSDWAELREAQNMTLSLPMTGQAVIIDIGEANDIHPKNKQDVGRRLAYNALAKDYGVDVEFSGPVYDSMEVTGSEIILTFNQGDLRSSRDGQEIGPLTRFQIAGEDQKFFWAEAKIDGDKVIVASEEVKQPVAVRYAWSNNPEGCNLYNSSGLPASPFRTDDWPCVTDR